MNSRPLSGTGGVSKSFWVAVLSSLGIASFFWMIDALFDYLWLSESHGQFLAMLLPLQDGHELIMRLMYSSVIVLTGIIVGATIQRLTKQQQAMREMADDLRITLQSIGEGVIAIDTENRISRMNPVAEYLTGWTEQEAVGQQLDKVFQIDQELPGSALAGAKEFVLTARDGSRRQIAKTAAPIRDGRDTFIGVVLVFRDISQDVRVRREMEHVHALLQAVVQQSHVPTVLVSADDARVLLVNQACLDFLSVTRDDLQNNSLAEIERTWQLFSPDGLAIGEDQNPLQRGLRGETTHGLELKVVDGQGQIRYTFAEGVPIRDGEDRVIASLCLFPDITERKLLEQERERLQKLESIGTLAGGIAHDFNNILMGVFGGIELAQMTLPPDHPSSKYIQTACDALGRATHLTKQLLTFARGGDPILEDMHLHGIVHDLVQFNLTGASIKPHIALAEDLWPIRGDQGQISHVLSNLIINAKQAMPRGGNLYLSADNVAPGRTNGQQEHRPMVRITLRDEGVGISENHLDRIFDPYFTTKQSGSGLGLAIVHSVVKKHGGSVRVESVQGMGTTFTILLPAAGHCAATPIDRPVQPSTVSAASARVLIMDDEPMVREVAREMLLFLGYIVLEAEDGKEALKKYMQAKLDEHPIDCMIMDLTIPGGMGGKEAMEKLKSMDPDARVIVASGYSTDPILSAYADYGFMGRLGKPFKASDLDRELKRVLADKPA